MGNDGGSIIKRDIIKTKKKEEITRKGDLDQSRWFTCALLQDPLQDPIVTDDLGYLFNKENVIQALLDGILSSHASFSHIKSLKSLYPVHFIDNPSYDPSASAAAVGDDIKSPWYCPITKNEVGGHQVKFVLLKSCGHVFADRALSKIDTDSCFVCSKKFKKDDIITLNPSPQELLDIKSNLNKKKLKVKKVIKDDNIKKDSKDETSTTSTSTTSTTSSTLPIIKDEKKKRKDHEGPTTNSLTTKQTVEQANTILTKKMKSDTFSSIFINNSNNGSNS